jgi:hypothetical protein
MLQQPRAIGLTDHVTLHKGVCESPDAAILAYSSGDAAGKVRMRAATARIASPLCHPSDRRGGHSKMIIFMCYMAFTKCSSPPRLVGSVTT